MPPRLLPSAALAFVLAFAHAAPARAAGPRSSAELAARATEPDVAPNLIWLAAQLVPSSDVLIDSSGVAYGLHWQLTPLLYSFATDRRLSPWRFFVAEPVVRTAGSIELYAAPGYVAGNVGPGRGFWGRVGLRSYFPLAHRGEYLAWSVGGAALYARDQVGVAWEAGVHTLYGVLGLLLSHAPTPGFRTTTVTIAFRYF